MKKQTKKGESTNYANLHELKRRVLATKEHKGSQRRCCSISVLCQNINSATRLSLLQALPVVGGWKFLSGASLKWPSLFGWVLL
jgi:hypothetical protein